MNRKERRASSKVDPNKVITNNAVNALQRILWAVVRQYGGELYLTKENMEAAHTTHGHLDFFEDKETGGFKIIAVEWTGEVGTELVSELPRDPMEGMEVNLHGVQMKYFQGEWHKKTKASEAH